MNKIERDDDSKKSHHALRSFGAETPMPQWRERSALRTRPAPGEKTRQTGIWPRGDDANPIAVLAARYPVTCRLVGRASFRLAAKRFAQGNPPESPLGRGFGDDFPRFLRGLGNLACIEYVADVAELEMLRHKAEHAPYAPPYLTPTLSNLAGERLNKLRAVLHPSVCLIQSRFPVVTAWESNRTSRAYGMIELWGGEAAMVARPFLKVEVRRLPPGGYAFLRALSQGQTVAGAAETANRLAAGFDVASGLRLIEDAKVIVGVES
jgi:hypothetical protein